MSRQGKWLSRRRWKTQSSRRSGLSFEHLETRTLLAADLQLPGPPDGNLPAAPLVPQYAIDGWGNNSENPEWGSTGRQLLRLTTVEYADGVSAPAGTDRPSAREISNAVAAQDESVINDQGLTDLTWLWGQFIDHDIDLTHNATDEAGYPLEPFPIDVPAGDSYFDPNGTGDETIDLYRSTYDPATGDAIDNPRAQINAITAFIDGSVIYGSDEERAAELRTFGDGLLKTSEGDLLPFNEAGLDNAGGTGSSLFLAGDVRANENAALTAMHTLWVREHNRWAGQIAADNPGLTDEQIYQQVRSIVIAELQAITFNEFLPSLLGTGAIEAYAGYDPTVNPEIANVFSTAAYRFGHSMLSSELLRLNPDGSPAEEGSLALSAAFFAPGEITGNGIDSLLLGAATQRAQEIDNLVVDDVRNFLFGPPGAGGFDLASLNIQRGRDHGLADYNQTRMDFGLEPAQSFADITSDPALAAELEDLYGDVNNIDVWVGGLAEDHAPGASMGELFRTIIADQFARIRDGDAHWYQHVFSGPQLAQIENTSLSEVIRRNTETRQLRDNVFVAAPVGSDPAPRPGDRPNRQPSSDRLNRMPPPGSSLAGPAPAGTRQGQQGLPVLADPIPQPVNQPPDATVSTVNQLPPPSPAEPFAPPPLADRQPTPDASRRCRQPAVVDEAFAQLENASPDILGNGLGQGPCFLV